MVVVSGRSNIFSMFLVKTLHTAAVILIILFNYITSGVIFPLLVLTVQTVIPIILLLETNKRDRCDNGDKLTSEVYLAKIMA
jgi:hypothetical protein